MAEIYIQQIAHMYMYKVLLGLPSIQMYVRHLLVQPRQLWWWQWQVQYGRPGVWSLVYPLAQWSTWRPWGSEDGCGMGVSEGGMARGQERGSERREGSTEVKKGEECGRRVCHILQATVHVYSYWSSCDEVDVSIGIIIFFKVLWDHREQCWWEVRDIPPWRSLGRNVRVWECHHSRLVEWAFLAVQLEICGMWYVAKYPIYVYLISIFIILYVQLGGFARCWAFI